MIRRACPQLCSTCARGRFDLCLTGCYFERGINRSHGYFTSRATDPGNALIAVPPELAGVAVLAEPLSVVEKAVETAMRTHPAKVRRACVTGAGPVGLLAAMTLTMRGMEVEVVSIEPEDHPRVRLLTRAGIAYSRSKPDGRFDVVLEASGAKDAACAAVDWLAPCGVLVLIGAPEGGILLPALRMVVDNLSVAGIVNSARRHFDDAFADLARIPRPWLEALIERRPADGWRASLGAPTEIAKLVHVIDKL
jgi:threonine dehydrogenase-like Zn-dependent dehydrogenase